jgi:hypothetical protein
MRSVSTMCPLADNPSEVHHGKRAPVNVLRAQHSNETDARFQPVCAYDRSPDDPLDDGWEYTGNESRDDRPEGA